MPRASRYHPDWVLAAVSGAANPLWLTEWLSEVLDLRPGMRVLDLGCGRAISSVFLRREFGVQVWATTCGSAPRRTFNESRMPGLRMASFQFTRMPVRCPSRRDSLTQLPIIAPQNATEIRALEADAGSYLGYVRAVGRHRATAQLVEPFAPLAAQYKKKPLLRGRKRRSVKVESA